MVVCPKADTSNTTERSDRLLFYPDSIDFRLKYSVILTYASENADC